jgi:hypothetical protein
MIYSMIEQMKEHYQELQQMYPKESIQSMD